MKLDHERRMIGSRDQVREPETVYVYVYEYGGEGG